MLLLTKENMDLKIKKEILLSNVKDASWLKQLTKFIYVQELYKTDVY